MSRILFFFAVCFLQGVALAVEPGIQRKLQPVPVFSPLAAAAQGEHIPLDQIESPVPGEKLNPGDTFTALITLSEKGARRTQWLTYFQTVTPTLKEQSDKPASPAVIYSCCGNKWEFNSSPSFASLRTLGPFVEPGAGRKAPKALDKNARFSVDEGFLGLGLDRACAAIYRAQQMKTKTWFWFSDSPCTEAQIKEGQKWAALTHLTPDEDRARCALGPALLSYFTIAEKTQGLKEILYQVVDLPSIWSMVRHAGVSADLIFDSEHIAPADPSSWSLPPGFPVYYFPMILQLNHHPALKVTMVVTTPQPPLLACGGVIGMLIEKPGDDQTYLMLRLISAHRSH